MRAARVIVTMVIALELAAVVLVGLGGCKREARPDRADWRVMQLYGGGGSIEILKAPSHVEGFRISKEAEKPGQAERFIGPIPVVSGPVTIDAASGAEIAALLLDAATYDFDRAKSDPGLDPTVGLRFSLDASRVDVALCFPTRQILIYRHGKLAGFEDFDGAADRLLALVKTGFPDDAEIQGW